MSQGKWLSSNYKHADMENHSSPREETHEQKTYGAQHQAECPITVIECIEAQCGSVWDLKTSAGSRLKRDLTPFWILSSGALPGSQSKDWREKITSGFQQQEWGKQKLIWKYVQSIHAFKNSCPLRILFS